ncbi:5-carboxymethyl-2-hydroxymuconate isomerase [Acinetobacter sp. ANC 4169]|uniref:5-carboxymethyl-2-hydroxymuconate Delta-isomerase n=1 Tax=Acinetobacter sp. ANC 4169 TaxID=1977879 RepID=UPI000A354E2C|nr:5-carboxymethyl-2-hydroxymuconate isomerase [Acinetobacter sp. ANC 4169]OTG75117.1 5-carboxymethyl-2-hydroxymuconate isomerase [Acinetobacter sp. ANC 4169]
MPHIHLEYSDNVKNLEAKPILLAINKALVEGAYVGAANELKSRAICQHDFVIGLEDTSQAYVHAKVSLLTGRSVELQQQIAQVILQTLEQHVPAQSQVRVQLCVEILEMQKTTYSKKII